MTGRLNWLKLAATIAAAGSMALAGCASTPDAVYELANKTDANVGLLSAQLHQIALDSSELYDRRASNIAWQASATAQMRIRFTTDLWLTRKVGDADDLALMGDLEDWLKQANDLAASAEEDDKTRRAQLAAGKVKIDEKAVPLGKVANALSALATRETAKERAKMIASFGKEVRNDLKKQLDDGSTSSNAAKALLVQAKVFAAPASAPASSPQ